MADTDTRIITRGEGLASLYRTADVTRGKARTGTVRLERTLRAGRVSGYRVWWAAHTARGFKTPTQRSWQARFKSETEAAHFAAEKLATLTAWVEAEAVRS